MTSNDVAIKDSSKVILIEAKLEQLDYSDMKSDDDLFWPSSVVKHVQIE
jgi:hypothetical protein